MTTTAFWTDPVPAGVPGCRVSRIVVATDGSCQAARAGDAARDLARRLGAVVDVVAVWDVVPASYALPGIASAAVWVEAEAAVRQLAARTAAEFESSGVRKVVAHVAEGRASQRIKEIADDVSADLVVMGSRGCGPVRRLVLGSTSEEVLHTSGRPVLVARGGLNAWPPRQVLAAHDGLPAAHEAARLAAVLAAELSVPLHLVGVVPGGVRHDARDPRVLTETRSMLANAATRIADLVGVTPEVHLRCGDPAHELLALAARDPATLLAIGAGNEGAHARHPMGRTATKIVHSSPGSVLVVPAMSRRGG